MPSPPELITLPDVALDNLLEKLDYRSIMILRKVCLPLRNYIDDKKPDGSLRIIEIFVADDKVVPITETEDGIRHSKVMYLKDQESLKNFYHDLKLTMSFQHKILARFSIYGRSIGELYDGVFETIGTILMSRNPPMKTQFLTIGVKDQEQALQVLPHFDPKSLKKLRITGVGGGSKTISIDKIVKLEHWKRCEKVEIPILMVDPDIQWFEHFEEVDTQLFQKQSVEEWVAMMKNIFICSPSIQKWRLEQVTSEQISQFIQVLGPRFMLSINWDFKNWYYEIPDTDEVLRIYISYRVSFARIKRNDMPANAYLNI